MIKVTFYHRADCHLCDTALSALKVLQAKIPHELILVNIDGNQELQRKFGESIPVIEVGPYTLQAPFDSQILEITLEAAVQREAQIQSISESIEAGVLQVAPLKITRADRFSFWISRRYMTVLNLLVLLYVGLPFLAPVMMISGATGAGGLIYRIYGAVCHQLAFRSWFLFGEQPAYPRQVAGVDGLIPYGEITGLSEEDQVAARQFTGNPIVGYKVALCQRDIAIYGGILIFGLVFSATGKKLKPIPWYLWFLIGILPIAVDGFSQLFSQQPFNLISLRESTPFLRTLTGFLFGLTTAWFGYPLVEETMVDIRHHYESKLKPSKPRPDMVREPDAIPPA